ncbi:MAG: phospho-sugar mutase [Eubacteriales bacterium]|nr:phospho-sugar mutase [Eubacteriales bacterium]
MGYREKFEQWKEFARDGEVAAELLNIEDDAAEIESRFSSTLQFGTAGLRSRLGAGTNRMNVYTVSRATQGLADYVKKHGAGKGMAVAYDTRHNSDAFARAAALCFAANGIKTYLFPQPTSVPELSFAIRHLGAFGGVVITASHNPKDYSGYKVYAPWGGQLLDDASDEVTRHIERTRDFDKVLSMDPDEARKKGLLVTIGDDTDKAYFGRLLGMAKRPENIRRYAGDIRVVYTPLFGTGLRTFLGVIGNMPYQYSLVESQSRPDPEFPGVKTPNPEDERAMQKAIALAHETGADIAFGTDPDADRLGVAIPSASGEFIMLSGNQVGCVLIDYLLRHRKDAGLLKPSDYIVKSFVSTRMTDDIAKSVGIECVTVPTGFKYISDIINNKMTDRQFVFGFEESCGYLADDYVADKDGIMAGMLLLEALCECRAAGETLYQRLEGLYNKYGWHKEKVLSAMMEGPDGMEKVGGIMRSLRDDPPQEFGGQRVLMFTDYQAGTCKDDKGVKRIDFPRVNALYLTLENGWLCIRPSGTEPKIKVYCGVCDKTNDASEKRLRALEESAKAMLA